MEANFFRSLFGELGPWCTGKRIEKIYEPFPGVLNLKFGSNLFLLFAPSVKRGAVFLASAKPENPQTPSNRVRRLRKRLQNRKVLRVRIRWPERKAAFQLNAGQGRWLLLDLQEGLSLQDELDDSFDADPAWPSMEDIVSREHIYREYPQLTPPLRQTLNRLPPAQARQLYTALQQGRSAPFSVVWKAGTIWTVVPWELPRDFPNLEKQSVYSRAIDAAEAYGNSLLQEHFAAQNTRERQFRRAVKRIEKNLERLHEDKARLQRYCAEGKTAEQIQSALYALDVHAKKEHVELRHPDGTLERIALNSRYTLLENMEQMFQRAKKGTRGLKQVHQRQQSLEQTLSALKNREIDPDAWTLQDTNRQFKAAQPAVQKRRRLPLHQYRTSEGFRVLQGKNQKANHTLLTQVARPYDYWFHAQDGPGAHVILQRGHREQPVARENLLEAAAVAGAAGYQSREAKARVICALVKHVHTMKGAPPGQVRVERLEDVFVVPLNSDMMNRLQKIDD